MNSIAAKAGATAETMREIAEADAGERGRRAGAAALALDGAAARLSGADGGDFLLARAARELDTLPAGRERSILHRFVELAGAWERAAPVPVSVPGILVAYTVELEGTGRLPEAVVVLDLARSITPGDPEIALHAARVARKAGDRERALELYGVVRELDAPCGRFTRLAAIGEALISPDPIVPLGRAIREAIRARDAEAAAVGLEERSRIRRHAGDRPGAIRDLCAAATRYADPIDRARVAHLLADVAIAGGDALAAREALLLALELGDPAQRVHARTRLYALSRAIGDRLGMRRWRPARAAALTSLLPYLPTASTTAAPVIARWRERAEERLRRTGH